ncbi:putative neutral zinc metallopeptidase [Roseomonas sp. TAS13]|uniref:neutral zinc metallopeptidase n=1 Tax=Roseomonas sp. TAS13 TaxID=1926319 RepID=UPI0009660D60|nr:neutral zinc metallopeptidase [Roseomonas sp. TAS13]GAV34796.1 putative neutral zinc metallopeptidase [Roseomonas sp. TAS13]
MRLDGPESENVEDRRGQGGGFRGGLGGGGGFRIPGGRVGGGLGTIAILLIAAFLGVDLTGIVGDDPGQPAPQAVP